MSERMDDRSLVLRPIGVVRNGVSGGKHHGWEEVVSEVVLAPHLAEALDGIEEYSHVEVIFWLDRAHQPTSARIHPQDRQDLPLVGFLATRTPNRPNPLGLTVARIRERQGSTLVVQGLDAYDGTSVLDIKPFMPRPLEGVRVPAWMARMREGHRPGGAETG